MEMVLKASTCNSAEAHSNVKAIRSHRFLYNFLPFLKVSGVLIGNNHYVSIVVRADIHLIGKTVSRSMPAGISYPLNTGIRRLRSI